MYHRDRGDEQYRASDGALDGALAALCGGSDAGHCYVRLLDTGIRDKHQHRQNDHDDDYQCRYDSFVSPVC